MGYEIIFSLVHSINREKFIAEYRDISNEDLKEYVEALMRGIMKNRSYRYYKPIRETTEVNMIVQKSVREEYIEEEDQNNIAEKYLDVELEAQARIEKMNIKIREGYLIEVLLKDEEHFYYIISKVENGDYLDNETVKKRTGLPYNDKMLKSALYVFNKEKERESILVADTAKTDYWAGKFLEIEEENQDEICTQKIYTAIEGMIKRETIGASEKENRSYVDYYNLRNNLIVYFKQPREFDFDEMMNCVFGKYEPEHPRLINMNKLKDKVQEKLLSSKYDTAFTIAPQAVKKNMKHIFKVNFCVEMNVVSGAENMRNLIEAFMQDEAAYLKIKVEEDETFKAFFHNKKK